MINSLTTWIQLYPTLTLVMFMCFALMIGSVLSMMVYRLPLMLDLSTTNDQTSPLNLFLPRSHCTQCKKTIPIYHNIPIVSYLCLLGRCHYCQQRISWHYPTIELLTLILSLAALYDFGYHLILLFILPMIWITLCLGFIDLKHQLLPDSLTLSLLWLGLLANTQNLFCALPNAVYSAVGAYLCLWTVMKLFFLCTGKVGMGHGDFKLFAAFGAWFGWTALIPILLISSILGSMIGFTYLHITQQNRDTPIPFGPFLCVAGLVYLFFPMLKQF